jgi:hypothetical protein
LLVECLMAVCPKLFLFPMYSQQDVTFLNLFISITPSQPWSQQVQQGLTNIRSCMYSPSSWWWVEVPPETCRALLK